MSDRQVMRTLLLAAGVDEDTLGVAYTAIDRIEREDRGKSTDRLTAAGINKGVVDRLFEIGTLRGLENTLAALSDVRGGDEAGEHLATCHGALTSMGLGDFLDVDLSIVRGLAYYTGIVYELFDAARSLRAICGGGRYDGLLAALGGVDLPATGFGMGDVVITELLRDHSMAPPRTGRLDAFLVAVTASDVPEVLRIGHALRDQGVRVEYALKAQAVAKQLKIAAARQSTMAVLVGPDERKAGRAVVRNLETGNEERISFDRLVSDYNWAAS